MARARILKPGFFTNELLAKLPFEARLLYAGLWLLADREGRLEDRPERIKAEIFPHDTGISEHVIDTYEHQLEHYGFLRRFSVREGRKRLRYIHIPTFIQHQRPHPHEAASRLPAPPSKARMSRQGNDIVKPMSRDRRDTAVTLHGMSGCTDSDSDSDPDPTKYSGAASAPPSPDTRALQTDPAADQNLAVVVKLVHEILTLVSDGPDLAEVVKSRCAELHIAYTSRLVARAIDSARVQRTRRETP